MTGQQLALDFWLERPRRPGARGWAPEVASTSRRASYVWRRGGFRRVRTIRIRLGGVL